MAERARTRAEVAARPATQENHRIAQSLLCLSNLGIISAVGAEIAVKPDATAVGDLRADSVIHVGQQARRWSRRACCGRRTRSAEPLPLSREGVA